MFLLEGQYVYEQMYVCMYVCVILGRCVFVSGGLCVCVCGGGVGGFAVGCYLFVSYPRCLLPSPYQCLCGSTYCTTFLWISFFMCNSHQPHHANKGKCVWKKEEKKKKRKPFFLSVAPPYYPPFFPVMNVPSSSAVVPLSVSAAEWLWFVLSLITIKETSLKFFKKGDLKVTGKKTMLAVKCGFQINSSSLPLLRLYIKVLNESWLTRGEWHEPVLSTSVSLWSFSPNKETRL